MINAALLEAAVHLRWLLERSYPRNTSVKLTGDRHRLDRAERQILYRGVTAPADAARRKELLVKPEAVAGRHLAVDGHNVVLTTANFLAGIPVFEADDGLLRDIGSLHGRLHNPELMYRALDTSAEFLASLEAGVLFVVFDAPLSHSRDHAARFRSRLTEAVKYFPDPPRLKVELAASGDKAVKACSPELIATSDSAVIDALGVPVFDLARHVLELAFDAEFGTLAQVDN